MSEARSDQPLAELVRRTDGAQPWRRAFHLVGGCGVAWVVYALGPSAESTRWLFGAALGVACAGDLARLRSPELNRFAFRVFSALLCPREADRPSLTWFLLGVFLVLWFPVRTVVPALLVLALADPTASVVGRAWGRRRVGKGTLEGSVAFPATALLVLIPFVGIGVALPTAVAAASVEVLPGRHDDNVLIPMVTAACLSIFGGV
ncbi:MAG: hypothetical protein FJ207_11375 [Gemmatimonadetes bacterium]|nr:hypothetical protein [Gemmatimonadota bacterium]